MNNEIQLSNLGQSLPMQPGANAGALGGYGGAGGGAGGGGDENPLLKVHRLLRGRYLLACVLGFLGAAVGAVAGYLSQKPAFKADLIIEMRPILVKSDGQDKLMVMFSALVNSQMATLGSSAVADRIVNNPEFIKARGNLPKLNAAQFGENLAIALAPRSNTLIMATYTCKGPQAPEECKAATALLQKFWREAYDTDEAAKAVQNRADHWTAVIGQISNQMDGKRKDIVDEQNRSPGPPAMVGRYEENLKEMEDRKLEAERTIAQIEQEIKRVTVIYGAAGYPAREWEELDKRMAELLTDQSKANDAILVGTKMGFGKEHQEMRNRYNMLTAINELLEKRRGELNQQYVILTMADGKSRYKANRNIDTYKQQIETATSQSKQLRDMVAKIRLAGSRINQLTKELDAMDFDRQKAKANLDEVQYQLKYGGSVATVKNDGKVPVPDKDRRILFSAAGFMGGAGIPIGLLMLFGLFDTRYRYSDETGAGAAGLGGLTLLGILPNLPDRLSDPEQAAIAAHCVHQIRTMLQINANLEDRRVFAVTSASPGDGKTSLTLALGLSYAACGTRTLLIDCDLIGSGLSNRMNVSAPEGVLEAIANQSLMSYVRQTDVNDVSILPVGSSGNLHASTLSPQSLRRLIAEAEQHFEVVMIDTGPILGSIEASLVCAAADAVILTVARGQQRPMVERSLGHLGAIGARLAGVVFNRAQTQDFERSISGVAMRSVGVPGLPRGARPTGPRLGPVARAMQGDDTIGSDDYSQPPTNE